MTDVDRGEVKDPAQIYHRVRASLYAWEHGEPVQIGISNADVMRAFLDLHTRLSRAEKRILHLESAPLRRGKKRSKK